VKRKRNTKNNVSNRRHENESQPAMAKAASKPISIEKLKREENQPHACRRWRQQRAAAAPGGKTAYSVAAKALQRRGLSVMQSGYFG
jgi:hypothetical protein